MYCKNCGNELDQDSIVCLNCGFAKGTGEHYCPNCGQSVDEGQYLCLNCGKIVQDNSSKVTEEDTTKPKNNEHFDYTQYRDKIKNNILLSLIGQGISLVLIISILFIPIFKCKYKPKSLEELDSVKVETVEDFSEFLKTGTIDKNFSLFEDYTSVIQELIGRTKSDSTEKLSKDEKLMRDMLLLSDAIFPIFVLVMAATAIAMILIQLKSTVDDFMNLDNTTMLKCTQIKKTGSENKKKEKFFKKHLILCFLIYIVIDIFFVKMYNNIFQSLVPGNLNIFYDRYVSSITAINGSVIFVFCMLVAYLYIQARKNNGEKALVLEITQKEYDN